MRTRHATRTGQHKEQERRQRDAKTMEAIQNTINKRARIEEGKEGHIGKGQEIR